MSGTVTKVWPCAVCDGVTTAERKYAVFFIGPDLDYFWLCSEDCYRVFLMQQMTGSVAVKAGVTP